MKFDYEIGDMVVVALSSARQAQEKAIVLGFEDYKLFDSVKCVKIMVVGSSEPTFTLSDRIRKL